MKITHETEKNKLCKKFNKKCEEKWKLHRYLNPIGNQQQG